KAVILDLRNNPGGFFSQALAVLRQFAPRGPILEMVEGNGRRQVFYSYQDRNRWPLVILINGGSASGAEIVAASLKDLGAATLVGTPSFGKGTIQTVLPLQGGAAVKLTTARYFTPRGNPITGAGLQPDVLVHQPTGGVGPLRLQRVLSRGTGGLDVARLQEALGALGYFGGRVDGIFGAETEAAVRAFQAGVGLPETGVVDGETAAALDRVLTGGSGGRDLQLERALQLLREGMGKVGGDTADRK
ncbi:MAG: S41 family peptidase, partial [bacterium]